MGEHRETALAARDWNLLVEDAIQDLLDSWDSRSDMAGGASDEDRAIAREMFAELCEAWGAPVTDEEAEEFCDRYDAALKKAHGDWVAEIENRKGETR